MSNIVSITSQGQLTIPAEFRRALGISGSVKAVIRRRGQSLIVEPKTDFWSLEGSLSSGIKLSDKQLREARQKFSSNWSKQ